MSMIFFVSCCSVLVSGFCRLAHTDITTQWRVRFGIWALTVAALAAIWAVLFKGYSPGWPSAVLVLAMAILQWATSINWVDGVPKTYREHA